MQYIFFKEIEESKIVKGFNFIINKDKSIIA